MLQYDLSENFLRFQKKKKKKKSIRTVSSWMKYQDKLSEKYLTALYCISNFAGTSYKMLHDTATSSFISWCFTQVENFIYHYQKNNFCHEFSLFNGFTQNPPTPHPVNSQNPLSLIFLFLLVLPNLAARTILPL